MSRNLWDFESGNKRKLALYGKREEIMTVTRELMINYDE